ncbi:MAG: hypothetical protein C0420_01850 [Methylobacterium sp.]|nr:hypothetical protein [Methylobacterium sp.]
MGSAAVVAIPAASATLLPASPAQPAAATARPATSGAAGAARTGVGLAAWLDPARCGILFVVDIRYVLNRTKMGSRQHPLRRRATGRARWTGEPGRSPGIRPARPRCRRPISTRSPRI